MQGEGDVPGKTHGWSGWEVCLEEVRLALDLERWAGFGQREGFWVEGREGPPGAKDGPGLSRGRTGEGAAEGDRSGIESGRDARAAVELSVLFMPIYGEWKEMMESLTHVCFGVRRESGTS